MPEMNQFDEIVGSDLKLEDASDTPDLVVSPEMKYNEEEFIDRLSLYVGSTYGQHYAGINGVQAFDVIVSSGHGLSFTVGNILKYAARVGRKGTPEDWRKDIMKIAHYAMMADYCLALEMNEDA